MIVVCVMGVPVLGRVNSLCGVIRDGDEILLDATKATATVRPSAQVADVFAQWFVKLKEK